MVVNRNKRNKGNKSKGNKDFFGLLLIIVSTVFLLCLIVPFILSFIGAGIRYVLLGLFGVFAYALFGGLLALGVCMFLNKKIRVNKSMLILAVVDLFILMLILQLVTSGVFLSGKFGEYLGSVYERQYTAGGAVFGIIAYGLAFAMTSVGAYVVLGLTFAAVSFFIGRKIYLKYYVPSVVKKVSDKSALSNDYDASGEPVYDSFEPRYRQARPVRPASSLFCERIVTKESRNADFTAGDGHRPAPEQTGRKQEPRPREQQETASDPSRRMGAQEARNRLYERDDDSVNRRNSDQNYREQLRNSLYDNVKKSEPAGKQSPLQPIIQPGAPSYADEFTIPKSSMPRKIVHENKNINRVVLPTPKQDPGDVPGDIINSTNLFKAYPQPPIVREYGQQEIKQSSPPKHEPARQDELPPILSASDMQKQKKSNPSAGFGFFTNFEEEAQSKFAPKLENPQPEVIEDDDFGIISSKSFENDGEDLDSNTGGQYNFIKQRPDEINSNPIIRFDPYADDDDEYLPEPKKYNPIKQPDPDYNDAPIINTAFLNEKANAAKEARKNDFNRPVSPQAAKPSPPNNDIVTRSSFESLSYDDDDLSVDETELDGAYDEDIEIISSLPEKNNYGLVVDDEVIDKTESNFDFGSNDSGYYVKEDAPSFGEDVYKPKKSRSRAGEPIGGQITIDDTVSFIPEKIPVIKRAEPYYYSAPPLDLLLEPVPVSDSDAEEIGSKRELIEATLSDLKYAAKVINVIKGPTVTRFELQPPAGMSVRKILGKDSDIEYALATKGVRIEAPIAGKQAIGIEVPNVIRAIVYLRELLDCPEFASSDAALPLALGKDLGGSKIIRNLEKMPHLLVAGATGTGKSVCLNALILSLVYHCSPEDLRMILVDPKCVEFSAYRNLPHLLVPNPIIDPQHTINSFDWAITEMNNRYQLFSAKSVRNIGEYNKTSDVKNGKIAKLPYVVIIVDELADLMLSRKREVEDRIRNITQKSRAAGIHLILATQRPSVDVITGTIKINLPCRIAFSVTSNPDSRTVLDQGGAESLIGNGDMLFMPQDSPDLKRLQGALVTNDEITSIVNYVIQNNKAIFDPDIGNAIYKSNEPVTDTAAAVIEEESGDDKILPNIMRTLITAQSASTSMIQRRFAFGYARAARIIDIIEQRGWIGKMEGSKPREVFMTVNQFEDIFGRPFNEEE